MGLEKQSQNIAAKRPKFGAHPSQTRISHIFTKSDLFHLVRDGIVIHAHVVSWLLIDGMEVSCRSLFELKRSSEIEVEERGKG